MIIASNLKCNHTRASFENYARVLDEFLKNENLAQDEIFVFPSNSAFCFGISNFSQGAQNFYPTKNGAFTGEIGLLHLTEFKIKSVLIGHSERRNLGETNEFLLEKFAFAKRENFKIIFCVGEDLKIKKSGKSIEFLEKQLENLDLNYENLILAYEPIYSIGTGICAKLQDIAEILSFLREKSSARLIYGGSVNEENVTEIVNLPNCDGVLIGSAALEIENFKKIIRKIKC